MATNSSTVPSIEPIHTRHAHLLCWKSVLAGVLIAIMSYMILAALGAGVAGWAAQSVLENEKDGSWLATGAGLWMGLSVVISLFLGSYFSVRIAKSVTNKVGAAHGFVVASLFFIILMIQASYDVGILARGFGHLLVGVGQSSSSLAANPIVQDTVDRALSNVNLKSDPRVVAEGLTLRLLQGDVDSAKAYFSYQSGLSGPAVDAKITQFKAEFDSAVRIAAERTARVVADTGLSLFVIFIVGQIGALFGGRYGAHANTSRPLANETEISYPMPILANQMGNVVPYVFGWLLGVPFSILLLIYVLRTVL